MRRPLPAALALVAGAALLQACGGAPPPQADAPPPQRHQAAQAAGPSPAPMPTGADMARDGGFTPAAAQRAAQARSPRAARDLTGLTDGQLLAVMGEPDLKREEDSTQAWLYRGATCLLDVFLEAEGPAGEPRVVLAAARPVGTTQVAEEACLRGLARARAGLRPPFQP